MKWIAGLSLASCAFVAWVAWRRWLRKTRDPRMATILALFAQADLERRAGRRMLAASYRQMEHPYGDVPNVEKIDG